MDFTLPSVLMPLVSPYLNYEEASLCMRLNSDFYNNIDNNWKDMPKKVIYIDISQIWQPSEEGTEEHWIDVEYDECREKLEDGLLIYEPPLMGNNCRRMLFDHLR